MPIWIAITHLRSIKCCVFTEVSTVTLGATDLRILEQRQKDASLSNVELARRVHLSPSPCLARVRALEERG